MEMLRDMLWVRVCLYFVMILLLSARGSHLPHQEQEELFEDEAEILLAKAQLSSTCDHGALSTYLKWVAERYGEVARLVPIGNSTEGRELWTLVITHDPQQRPLMKPQVKFVGNINGYSGPSCVLLVKLITFLVENYENDAELRQLLHRTVIHIMPSMNPDGYVRAASGRCSWADSRRRHFKGNAKGVDLNRNFPDMFHPLDDDEDDPQLEPETEAVIQWMKANSFVVSTSFWSGAQIVTYPYDSAPDDHPANTPHETPDAKTFEYLARNYVEFINEDPTSHWFCGRGSWNRPEGIVNGALLSRVTGSMMDYNYNNGVFELYIGMDCCINDNNSTELELIWRRHKYAMIGMIREAEFSFRGQVVDSETGQAMAGVEIVVIPPPPEDISEESQNGIHMPFFTNERGEFFRVLLAGKYFLKAFYKNYEVQTMPIEITMETPPEPLRITMVSLTRSRRLRIRTTASPQLPQITNNNIPLYNNYYPHTQRPTVGLTVERTELSIHEEINNINLVVEAPRFNFSARNHDGIFHELEGYPKPLISEQQRSIGNLVSLASLLIFVPNLVLLLLH